MNCFIYAISSHFDSIIKPYDSYAVYHTEYHTVYDSDQNWRFQEYVSVLKTYKAFIMKVETSGCFEDIF